MGLATVSRVVNGAPGVSPERVRKVREAARELGYRHDATASSLRRADRRTNTVALVVEDVANPYSSALHRAITDAAAERGILALSGSSDEDPPRERELVETFIARQAHGLIVVPTGRADDALRTARRFGTPLAVVDRIVKLDGPRVPVRVLGRLPRDRHDPDPQRPEQCRGRRTGGARGVGVPEPPTAFVSGRQPITIGVRRAPQDAGLEDRIALAGFGDFPLADLLTPGVSVIAQDSALLGREAARLLFARLDGSEGPARHSEVPTRYVARGSGEIAAPAE